MISLYGKGLPLTEKCNMYMVVVGCHKKYYCNAMLY
jgi:hypothetical protein